MRYANQTPDKRVLRCSCKYLRPVVAPQTQSQYTEETEPVSSPNGYMVKYKGKRIAPARIAVEGKKLIPKGYLCRFHGTLSRSRNLQSRITIRVTRPLLKFEFLCLGLFQVRPGSILGPMAIDHAKVTSNTPPNTVSLLMSSSSPFIVTKKHLLAMFDQELHRSVLSLRILHFSCQALRPHNSWCEYNGHVLACHQILRLLFHDPRQMKYQHF